MKINRLEIENVKRIRAVKLEPTANGLTVIGGRNEQGKTSVLDSIAWALGGDKYRPSNPTREGSTIPPLLKVVMSNGLVVERRGKNSELKVTDPEGNKGGQQLLNEFVEQLALDLPRFLESSAKEKANTLLQVIGVGEKLLDLESKEKDLYSRRHAIGQIADQKKKFAAEQPYYPDAPKEPVSASDLIRQQQDILAMNGENERKRHRLAALEQKAAELQKELERLLAEQKEVLADLETARKSSTDLKDESTAELEKSIQDVDDINRMVRANLDKEKAEDDAREYTVQYEMLSAALNTIRDEKMSLLKSADLPLDGLSVEDGELTYKGFKWDGMSGSQRLQVATAIVRKLNPQCQFVLLDKLEQLDIETLHEFGQWLETEGLQAIATRVSTGDECSVIIEDGYAVVPATPQNNWKAGQF